jgi:HSF-type DNA-binding
VYQDHSDKDDEWVERERRTRGIEAAERATGATMKFPIQLHNMLSSVEELGLATVVNWMPHGRAFKIYDKKRFVKEVLPRFFRFQTDFASFQRQLNLYNLLRLTGEGPDQKAYYHELLLRGHSRMATLIPRQPAGAHSKRRTYDSTTEPDFRTMEPILSVSAQLSIASSERNGESIAAGSNRQFAVGKKTRGLSISDYERPAKSQNDDTEGIDPTKLVASTDPAPLLRHIKGDTIYHAGSPVTTSSGTQSTRRKRRKTKATLAAMAEPVILSTRQMTSIALDSTVEAGSIAILPPVEEPSTIGQCLAKRQRRDEPRADMTDGTSGGDEHTIRDSGDSSDSESPSNLAGWADFLGSVDLDSSPESTG